MKHLPLTLCLVAVSICVALLIRKNSEVHAAQVRAALAEASRDAATEQAAAEASHNEHLRANLHETRAQAAQRIRAAQEGRKASAPGAPETKERSPRTAAFLRDPEMKEALAAQSKQAVWKNVKELFNSGLAQQLQLNDEQTAALRQLLLQKLTLLSEQLYLPMMTGDLDASAMAESGRATRQAFAECNAQIRQLLGDEGFAAYERFEKTQPERENLRRFLPQFAENGESLTADQQNQLLAAMVEERLNFNFQHDLGDMSQWDFEHWYDNVTDEKLDAYAEDMNRLNARMSQRARELLSPEQARQFESLLRERTLQAKFVVQTTRAMTRTN
jgi:hypothetical protein